MGEIVIFRKRPETPEDWEAVRQRAIAVSNLQGTMETGDLHAVNTVANYYKGNGFLDRKGATDAVRVAQRNILQQEAIDALKPR